MDGISIRPYVQGQDDEVLLHIYNTSRAGTPDFVPQTLEEFRVESQSPGWTADGNFIAELDGTPVGVSAGIVDPHRPEPVGDLSGPAVLPGHRRRGVGIALAHRALAYLRSRGMELVRASTGDWNEGGRAFLARLGFAPVRRYSLMRRPLAGLPSGIGENPDVEVETLGTSGADLALLVRLTNDAFRGHFGFRDGNEEERAYWVRNMETLGYVARRTVARLGGEPVGFTVHGHYPRDNEQLGTKRGELWGVGVLKEHRNKGVAKALMLDSMAWLASQGLDEVELGVDEENVDKAHRLYERLGFSLARGWASYERSLDAAPKGPGPALTA